MSEKATIVSIVPFLIDESKPGIYPGTFRIPPVKDDDIEILVVGNSIHYVYLDETRGSIKIDTPAQEIARSVVEDFIDSQIESSRLEESHPGLFWVPGEFSKNDVLNKFGDKIKAAREAQNRWYLRLVRMADDDWSRYHQHKSISDTQRHAAKSLGLDKEWLISPKNVVEKRCPGCKSVVHPEAAICPSCRCILDKAKWQALSLAE